MNKKYIAIIAVVAIVIIAIIAVVLVVLPGLFTPPVDISGINPATTMTTDELLPSALAGKQLGSVDTVNATVTTDSRSFEVEHTSAEYNGVTVHIIKIKSESDASDTLDVLLDDDDWYGGASSHTQTNDWFTASKEGRSAFFWRSGIWIFGVDAENDSTRNDVANDLVQHLKGL